MTEDTAAGAEVTVDDAILLLSEETLIAALNGSRHVMKPGGEWTLPQHFIRPMAEFIAMFDYDQLVQKGVITPKPEENEPAEV